MATSSRWSGTLFGALRRSRHRALSWASRSSARCGRRREPRVPRTSATRSPSRLSQRTMTGARS
eukprot:15434316-Alexandrium_andersonii.AAC.1